MKIQYGTFSSYPLEIFIIFPVMEQLYVSVFNVILLCYIQISLYKLMLKSST